MLAAVYRTYLQRIAAGDDQGARVLLRDIDRLLASSRGTADFSTLFSKATAIAPAAMLNPICGTARRSVGRPAVCAI